VDFDHELTELKLSENAKEKYVIMVGDGLTQMRAKQFIEIVYQTSISYELRHEVTTMLQEALESIIFLPGDLHGGGFNISTILQKIQAVLKWKRIRGSNVSKCN